MATEAEVPTTGTVWRRRLLAIVPLAVFALIASYFYVALWQDPRILPSALLDKPAPNFDLPALLDTTPGLKTTDFKGQVTLVNVFASWCIPCRVEHPVLLRLAREGRVPLVGIDWKDGRKDGAGFLDELGNPFARIGYDGSGRVGIDWGVYGVPETYVIDKEGRIRYKVVGPMTPDELNGHVLPLIEKLKK